MTHEEQQARVEAVYAKWADRLGLYGWDVTRTYHDGQYIQGDGVASGEAAASTNAQWEYR